MAVIVSTRKDGSKRVQHKTEGVSLTVQSEKDNCDINKLISKYKRTGQLPPVLKTNGQYGDFSRVGDFHSAMNSVVSAQNAFLSLPAKLRQRFANDPAQLLQFLSVKDNYDEAVKLGLAKPRPASPPEETKKTPEAPSVEPQK